MSRKIVSIIKKRIEQALMPKSTEKEHTVSEILRRYIIFTLSLFIISIGVALTLRSDLGSSAISLLPYTWSLASNIQVEILGLTFIVPSWTIGQYTICMNIILVLLQIAMLRRSFQKIQLLQVITGLLFGLFIDFAMWLTSWFIWDSSVAGYIFRVVQLFAAGAIIGFGTACEVRCNVLLLPGEGLCVALSKVTGMDFGKAKIYNDTAFVCIGITFCFLFFQTWKWNIVGVATLISMVYVGVMARFFSFRLSWLDSILEGHKPYIEEKAVAENLGRGFVAITIAREFGSGGHEIGEKLAKQLGIAFYDQAIISETAGKLGISSDLVERTEQNISTPKLLELILTDKQVPESMNPSENDRIFITQSKIIRDHASKQSCVIIGRAVNYILKDHPCCLKVFVHAAGDFAEQRVMSEFGYDAEKARREIHHVNQARANHYWQYTGQKWNDPKQYDIVINSSRLGIDNSVTLIVNTVKSLDHYFYSKSKIVF